MPARQTPPRAAPGRRQTGPIRHVALALLGIILGLVVAESIVRVAHPIPEADLLPLHYDVSRLRRLDGDTYIEHDQALGWTSTPNVNRTSAGLTYRNNRAAIRADREYSADPPPGVRRIEAFGDSFTYCQDVNLRDCWTSGLERALPNTELLNFGVVGYGPDQAWLRYQRDGPAYHPCAVVMGYMIENINRVLVRFRGFYTPDTGIVLGKPRFRAEGDGLRLLPNPVTDVRQLEDPRWVEATLGPDDDWYFPGMFVPNPLDLFEVVRVVRTAAFRLHHDRLLRDTPTIGYHDGREAFQIVGRVLTGFARDVRATGATPVVVLLSPEPDLERAVRGEPPVYAPLVEWLAREGVATVDVSDALADEARRSGMDAVIGVHYRPLGNTVVATELARRLPPLVAATCDR